MNGVEVPMEEEKQNEERYMMEDALEYIYLINPETDELIYANRVARNHLLIPEEEWKGRSCCEILSGLDALCESSSPEEGDIFRNQKCDSPYVDQKMHESRFLVHCGHSLWEGRNVRKYMMINMNDDQHVETVLRSKIQIQETIEKCISHFNNDDNPQEQKQVLQIVADYYGAECICVMSSSEGFAECLNEYHRESSAELASALLREIHSEDIFLYEVLMNNDGVIYLENISALQKHYPELYQRMTQYGVTAIYARKLVRKDKCAGTILILNPHQNRGEMSLLRLFSVYLTGDIMRKRLWKQREYEMEHDELTGTWNRSSYVSWGDRWREVDSIGVCRADIVQLKDINREFGYEHGNIQLRTLANVFKEVFTGYRVFRYEQDEFVVVCPDIPKMEFERLISETLKKIGQLTFGVAVGYDWSDRVILKGLMDQAEEMMLRDRDRRMVDQQVDKRLETYMIEDTQAEISKGHFRVYLQPKVNINSGLTVGAEALIRLYEEKLGIVSPMHFVPILEQHNVIHLIDLFVFEEMFRFQQKAIEEGKRLVPISVNFSKNTLFQEHILETVQEISGRYQVPHNLIRIEITESVGDLDHIVVSNLASDLQKMGFQLSMDDFGTQYSNMEMLSRFHFDTAKIDRSMVKEITESPRSRIVLKHLIALIEDLGIDCVVEGAETEEQIELLKEMQCKVVQGYYFGRPVPQEEFYSRFM